jgi:predicted metal-dependent HD superfamily phosphohydrolase
VYNPRAGDNEERSADLARKWLNELNAADPLITAVPQLVLATKNHDGSLHIDAPLLVDVDLSVLGHPPERFWEYETQIRAEYAWVEQKLFATKRAEILDRFLARPRIYNTHLFFERYERQARVNLRESILKLRGAE